MKCDKTGLGYTSPDWVGAGWYRMMVPAGTRIPESPPGRYQCGTTATGWLRGSHPASPGRKDNVTYCFDNTESDDTDCDWSTQGKVTHCGDYFVYYLEDAPCYPCRYCATDHF